MRFGLTIDRARLTAALRPAALCCAAMALWLTLPSHASAGVMLSSLETAVEGERVNDPRSVDLPWVLTLEFQDIPTVPVSSDAGGGGTGGSSVPATAAGCLAWHPRAPQQMVTRLWGERTLFIPAPPTSDLLDPPRCSACVR